MHYSQPDGSPVARLSRLKRKHVLSLSFTVRCVSLPPPPRCVRHVIGPALLLGATWRRAGERITIIAPWRTKLRSKKTLHKGSTCKSFFSLNNEAFCSEGTETKSHLLLLVEFTVANTGTPLQKTSKVKRPRVFPVCGLLPVNGWIIHRHHFSMT